MSDYEAFLLEKRNRMGLPEKHRTREPWRPVITLPRWLIPDDQLHEYKQCGDCRAWLCRAGGFHKDKYQKDGLKRVCKNCSHQAFVKMYARRGEEIRAQARSSAAKPERRAQRRRYLESTREQTRRWAKSYRERNPDMASKCCRKWRTKNVEAERKRKREWDKANPIAVAEQRFRRRVRLMGARAQRLTQELIAQRVSVFGDKCAYCGAPWSQLDHVKPLARGGLHCLANLRPACESCNLRKSAMPPKKWFALLKTTGRSDG